MIFFHSCLFFFPFRVFPPIKANICSPLKGETKITPPQRPTPLFWKGKVKIILSRSASHKSCSQLIFPQHLTPQERSSGAWAGITLIRRALASISGDWEQLFPLLVLSCHQWIGGLWIVCDILEKIALQQGTGKENNNKKKIISF